MKKIVLTGGGTAGHVTPNIALLPALKENDFEVSYIGANDGIEKKLIEEINIPYYGISTGKLRRYFDLKNFSDPFRVLKGVNDARKALKEIKPDVIFSKGGFVSVPVVVAASMLKIPVVCHESDLTPGLANKLTISRAKTICCNFPETIKYLPEGKAQVTGLPIRDELLLGKKSEAMKKCGFEEERPTLLIIGGSLGSVVVNNAVREVVPQLVKKFNIIHLCGKGKVDESKNDIKGYIQFEYVKHELKHLLALADIVISRAGANSICELLALNKPNILIPLSAQASRGDQILNARSFVNQGFSMMIEEEDLNKDRLLSAIEYVYENKENYEETMKKSMEFNAIDKIVEIIKKTIDA